MQILYNLGYVIIWNVKNGKNKNKHVQTFGCMEYLVKLLRCNERAEALRWLRGGYGGGVGLQSSALLPQHWSLRKLWSSFRRWQIPHTAVTFIFKHTLNLAAWWNQRNSLLFLLCGFPLLHLCQGPCLNYEVDRVNSGQFNTIQSSLVNLSNRLCSRYGQKVYQKNGADRGRQWHSEPPEGKSTDSNQDTNEKTT